MAATLKDLSNTVGFLVGKHKDEVLKFLGDNLVILGPSASDSDIIKAMFDNFQNKDGFYENFLDWIAQKSQYANADGTSSFWDGANFGSITGLVSSGLGLFGNIKQSNAAVDAARAQAEAAAAAANAQTQNTQAQIELARLQLAAAQTPQQKSNTGLYIGVGVVGILLVGGIIIVATRK